MLLHFLVGITTQAHEAAGPKRIELGPSVLNLTWSLSEEHLPTQIFLPSGATDRIKRNGNPQKKTSWPEQIDMFIPWAGGVSDGGERKGQDIRRDRVNGELPILLRSIAKHAPWVHHIWISVNGDPQEHYVSIPASLRNRTQVVDRCSFMPPGTCPTRNGFAVVTFAHRLNNLSEHFIMVEDDTFLGRPVKPTHFFTKGKPFVWRNKPNWGYFKGQEFHRIYEDSSVAGFPTPRSSSPSPHFWNPQLKSVCASMERQYPEFYAFVATHVRGRYSSLAKGSSDTHNSQEEDWVGWMNWEYLRTGTGVYKNIDSKRYVWWDEVVISEAGFQKCQKDRPIFMNVNDRFAKNDTTYRKQIGWFQTAMEKMFPA